MRAVLLCRQSLTVEDSVSIAAQRDAGIAWCAEHGHTLIATITGESVRGTREQDKRADLSDVMALASRRAFDLLVVWKLDRLARNLRVQENVFHELEQAGISVASITEPHISTPLYRQLAGMLAEDFSRTLSARMKTRVAQHVKQHRRVGQAPYGYRLHGRQMEIVPDAAAVVVWIFEQYRSGLGSSAICAELDRQGIPPPRAAAKGGSRMWRADLIMRILRNPCYIGEQVIRGERSPGDWPSIVERSLWDDVQRLLRELGRAPRQTWGGSFLQGLLYHACGQKCYLHGGEYTFDSGTVRQYVYFRCRHSYAAGPDRCELRPRSISQRRAERAVRAQIRADLAGRIAAKRARTEVIAALDREAPAWERTRAALETRRDGLLEQQARVKAWYIAGRLSPDEADREYARIDGELQTVARQLAHAPAVPSLATFQALYLLAGTLRARLASDDAALWRDVLVTLQARPVVERTASGLVTVRYPRDLAVILGCPDRAL